MEVVFKAVKFYFFDVWETYCDHRLDYLPLLNSPWHVISLTLMYLFFVFVVGNKLMKNRPPFDLRNVMLFHNLLLVISNGICLILAVWFTNWGLITFKCEPFDPYSSNLVDRVLLMVGYLYYITKYVDFLDTVYFILRKKHNQITGLHIFHHSMMPFACYVYFKFSIYTNTAFTPMINSFVHTIMYSYYALTSIGKNSTKLLRWKKYITQLQLIQFIAIIVHSLFIFLNSNCKSPKFLTFIQMLHGVLFFNLFYSFYKRTYITNSVKKE